MWYVRYEITRFNKENEKCGESGLLCAANYTDAVEKIENFYKNDLIEINLLRFVCDGSVLVLSPDVLDAIEEEAGINV